MSSDASLVFCRAGLPPVLQLGSSLVVGAPLVVGPSFVVNFKNEQGHWEHVLELGSSLVVGAPLVVGLSLVINFKKRVRSTLLIIFETDICNDLARHS